MKINIVYDSKDGNGEKIAEDLMDIIKERGNEGHVYNARKTKPDKIGDADIYIFGSPTHLRGPSRRIRRLIKKAPFARKGKKYALFTTSSDGRGKAAIKMEKMLNKRGLRKGAGNLQFKTEGKKGPLERDYRDKIELFLEEVAAG
ncbi:MAG: flavodoxin family protein [Candidatus Natronoplasma sp.]